MEINKADIFFLQENDTLTLKVWPPHILGPIGYNT